MQLSISFLLPLYIPQFMNACNITKQQDNDKDIAAATSSLSQAPYLSQVAQPDKTNTDNIFVTVHTNPDIIFNDDSLIVKIASGEVVAAGGVQGGDQLVAINGWALQNVRQLDVLNTLATEKYLPMTLVFRRMMTTSTRSAAVRTRPRNPTAATVAAAEPNVSEVVKAEGAHLAPKVTETFLGGVVGTRIPTSNASDAAKLCPVPLRSPSASVNVKKQPGIMTSSPAGEDAHATTGTSIARDGIEHNIPAVVRLFDRKNAPASFLSPSAFTTFTRWPSTRPSVDTSGLGEATDAAAYCHPGSNCASIDNTCSLTSPKTSGGNSTSMAPIYPCLRTPMSGFSRISHQRTGQSAPSAVSSANVGRVLPLIPKLMESDLGGPSPLKHTRSIPSDASRLYAALSHHDTSPNDSMEELVAAADVVALEEKLAAAQKEIERLSAENSRLKLQADKASNDANVQSSPVTGAFKKGGGGTPANVIKNLQENIGCADGTSKDSRASVIEGDNKGSHGASCSNGAEPIEQCTIGRSTAKIRSSNGCNKNAAESWQGIHHLGALADEGNEDAHNIMSGTFETKKKVAAAEEQEPLVKRITRVSPESVLGALEIVHVSSPLSSDENEIDCEVDIRSSDEIPSSDSVKKFIDCFKTDEASSVAVAMPSNAAPITGESSFLKEIAADAASKTISTVFEFTEEASIANKPAEGRMISSPSFQKAEVVVKPNRSETCYSIGQVVEKVRISCYRESTY